MGGLTVCLVWEEVQGKKGMYRLVSVRTEPARSSIVSAAERLKDSSLFDGITVPAGGRDDSTDD